MSARSLAGPIILALDTTSRVGSVCIRRAGKLVSSLTLDSPDGFGHVIFQAIEKCRNEASLRFSEIDCFAAANGPGSFTGARVGLAAVKGLAESTGKPVAGVSNLRALSAFGSPAESLAEQSSFGNSGSSAREVLRAVVLDARRGEVYAALYDASLQLIGSEAVLPFAAFLERLDPARIYQFLSPATLPLAGTPFAEMSMTLTPPTLADAVALCAELDLQAGRILDPAALDANYVRRSDAELLWKDDNAV